QLRRFAGIQRREPAICLEIALEGQKVLDFFAVEEGRIEGVVVLLDRAEAGTQKIGTRQKVGRDLGTYPDLGFADASVVAGCAFQPQPYGDEILRHQLRSEERRVGKW